MTEVQSMDRHAFISATTFGLFTAPLDAKTRPAARLPTRRLSRAPWISRSRVAVIGLAAFGCVRATEDPASGSATHGWAFLAFLLVAAALYLSFSGFLVVVSQRRRRRQLGAIFVAVFAGSMCGALWVMLVAIVVAAPRPGALMGPAGLAVGVVTALGVAILLSTRDSLRGVAGLSAMTIGFHSLMFPIGVLIAFLVAGAHWPPATSAGPGVTAVILGIRLAGDRSTVGLSVEHYGL
jgi:hypothetical protein